jgi:hypothetical protein
MQEKEFEKRRDELFGEINPRTLPKQKWKRKEAPWSSTAKPAAGDQTPAAGGPTAADSIPSSQTAPSGGPTAQAQEGHAPLTSRANQASTSDSQPGSPTRAYDRLTVAEDSQTASPCSPTTSSCRIDARVVSAGLLCPPTWRRILMMIS